MISKDKMFIVSSLLDDSIKSAIVQYDISLFSSFEAIEHYISEYPVVVDSIIVPESELAFTSNNMQRLRDLIVSPFAKITGTVYYLISNNIKIDIVKKFLDDFGLDNVVVYQSDLTVEYLTDIASGVARESYEGETEIVTYRVRAKDYHNELIARRYESDDNHYVTDEEELAGIPDIQETPTQIPIVERNAVVKYFIGEKGIDRTLFSWLTAQYYKAVNRVLIVESDWEYHTLTDMYLKSHVEALFITVEEFFSNPLETLKKMQDSPQALTILGTKERAYYDYDFVMDILISNLNEYYDYIIREGEFNDAPYSYEYVIVSGSTVPQILEAISKLEYEIDESRVSWIALQSRDLGSLTIDSQRLKDLIAVTTGKENINAEVFKVSGVNFAGGKPYDFHSVLN